ncbi:hypothetical protein [Acidiferrobacter sp.]|uniref:hypothetical protein n=1 Tax=Acidiferrobacter sp. TaxID=1872107 RepID=UPI00260C5F57|nr:hypothetical protein [Acidiferrobacter sp.]
MYLLDTHVIGEPRTGPRTNRGVAAFFAGLHSADIDLAVQTIGEIRHGVEALRRRGDSSQAGRLEAWLDGVVEGFGAHIVSFGLECAQLWGQLLSYGPRHPLDKQIASGSSMILRLLRALPRISHP